MVVLNRIYTRTGDDGTTALGTGERRKKYDLRIASYGTVDELNAAIGLARLTTAGDAEIDAMLGRIQNDLFDLGADLCTPETAKGKGPGGERLTVTEAQVTRLEAEIDRLNADLAPLRSFVLPGGTAAAAHLHLARTICRRADDGRTRRYAGRNGVGERHQIRQPVVGFPVRGQPLRECQRQRRRVVGARP
jgi:cob(I)alamin adenosyltransferase